MYLQQIRPPLCLEYWCQPGLPGLWTGRLLARALSQNHCVLISQLPPPPFYASGGWL